MREWSVGQPRGAFFSGRQVAVGAEHAQRAELVGELVDQCTHGRFHVPLPTPPVSVPEVLRVILRQVGEELAQGRR